MPELERLMLHRLAELDALVQQQLQAFDIQTVRQHLASFRARLMSLRSFNSYRPSPIGDLQHG